MVALSSGLKYDGDGTGVTRIWIDDLCKSIIHGIPILLPQRRELASYFCICHRVGCDGRVLPRISLCISALVYRRKRPVLHKNELGRRGVGNPRLLGQVAQTHQHWLALDHAVRDGLQKHRPIGSMKRDELLCTLFAGIAPVRLKDS